MKERLVAIFSIYIRLRDTDDYGYGNCITCRNKFHYNEFECGHFRKRRHESTAYDERNAHAQCKECNNKDDDAKYIIAMLQKYPDAGVPDQIIQKSKRAANFTDQDYKDMYDLYKQKVLNLLQDKMFIVKSLP